MTTTVSATGFRRRWLGNSAANVVAGGANVMFTLVLPAVMARQLVREEFSVWSLANQISIYVGLFGIGLQNATATYVASLSEHELAAGRLQLIAASATRIGGAAFLCALIFVLLLVYVYPMAFPNLPHGLRHTFQYSLAIIGSSSAVQILALVPMGIFQGLHRNFVFVSVQVIVRLVTVLTVSVGAYLGGTVVTLVACYGASASLTTPVMWALCRRRLLRAGIVVAHMGERPVTREILHSCATLSVWVVSMLIVNAIGTFIVGRYDYPNVGIYSLAMSAAVVVGGGVSALLSPAVTMSAAAAGDGVGMARLRGLLRKVTLYCTFFLHAGFMFVFVLRTSLTDFWVGRDVGSQVAPLLIILVGAHCLRNLTAAYALMLIGTRQNRLALWTALAEAAANALATFFLGYWFGALGAAFGSVFGSAVGVLGSLIITAKKTPSLIPSRWEFSRATILMPSLLVLPLYFLCAWFA